MPGTIVVLTVIYGLFATSKSPQQVGGTGSVVTALWGIAFFLISYVLGSILSLRAADRTDRLSARLFHKEGKAESLEKVKARLLGFRNYQEACSWFSQGETKVREGSDPDLWPESPYECQSLWAYDEFPYACWSLVRLGVYCPKEVFEFYWQYHEQILAQVGKSPHFFNYCKMAVYAGNGSGSSPLAAEIQEAESSVRFLAGAFDALVISSGFLVALVFYHGVLVRLPFVLLPIFGVGALVVPPEHTEEETPAGGTSLARIIGRVYRYMRTFGGRDVPWAFHFVGVLACLCLIVLLFPGERESLGLIVLAIAEFLLASGIVSHGRLRRRRHAEVAAVMDAFFLTCGRG
jgi:hypothetical protein